MMKRIVGLPGKKVYNDEKQKKELVWEGCVFVVGNNRKGSTDSRYFGPVKIDGLQFTYLRRLTPIVFNFVPVFEACVSTEGTVLLIDVGRGMLPTIPDYDTLFYVRNLDKSGLKRGMVVTFTRDIFKNSKKKAILFEVCRIVALPGKTSYNDRRNLEPRGVELWEISRASASVCTLGHR
ncbi:hypothetical protein L596_028778 [Steinernema carpocapsae]|uniref:Mitochondrial inner membrane protease subunit 2 n=1 Tax=Steinernema carpocapsae TaxID=34508 RepID=A0A4U5LZB9_STECR|nr:hypothetical protein L596_028778 [Steinernema carpocapsae]